MALLKSESPAVTISEIDASAVVPAVTSSTGAIVGDFAWGPINQPVLVGNENELVDAFGSPVLSNDSSAIEFLSANQFLKYSTSLYAVRGATDAALNAADSTGTAVQIENTDVFDNETPASGDFFARYAGTAGNSLAVEVCCASAGFTGWTWEDEFDAQPGSSSYVTDGSAQDSAPLDEVHVIIYDEDGTFTGKKNTVLEKWANLSLATDAKTEDGLSNYYRDVLNNRSEYVYSPVHSSRLPPASTTASFVSTVHGGADTLASTPRYFGLAGGANSASLTTSEFATGFDLFEDENTIQVDFLIAPGMGSSTDQDTVVDDLTAIAEGRKDCVVVASPPRSAVVGQTSNSTIQTAITTWAAGLTKSSYLVVDNNYLKVYDKYNDKYEWVPAASSTAGLMANTDDVAAPWFSPAGGRRGRYLGVTQLGYNPSKSQRDVLYKADVNPIVNLPGQGIVLFGDKTFLGKNSAFNRINVRRLFLVMERAIKGAAQNILFEFNDEFSRAEFVGIVEPFLRDIQSRRGIQEFLVVCDETNNGPDVVDNNSFVASVFVKPARSINFVQLNFVAVRSGVDISEITGAV